jgi:hypothetical protein
VLPCDVDFDMGFTYVLWLKMILLNFTIFIYRLLLIRLQTKDLLVRRRVLVVSDNTCSADCGFFGRYRSYFLYLQSVWYHVVLDFRLAWYLDGFFMETFKIICYSLVV